MTKEDRERALAEAMAWKRAHIVHYLMANFQKGTMKDFFDHFQKMGVPADNDRYPRRAVQSLKKDGIITLNKGVYSLHYSIWTCHEDSLLELTRDIPRIEYNLPRAGGRPKEEPDTQKIKKPRKSDYKQQSNEAANCLNAILLEVGQLPNSIRERAALKKLLKKAEVIMSRARTLEHREINGI